MFAKQMAVGLFLNNIKHFLTSLKRSRLRMLLLTIVAWFIIAAILGTLSYISNGYKHTWLVYFYNSFTIFSNLNDDLNLTLIRPEGGGAYLLNIPQMIINFVLIITGMMGIALLTATMTADSINVDEEKFDLLVDEMRRMAIVATSAPSNNQEPPDAHRILGLIIDRIHNRILPVRNNLSINRLNIYEFEYLLLNIINRIIEHNHLLHDPVQKFAFHDLNKINAIINWAKDIDSIYPYFEDLQPSPIVHDFKHAWVNFSIEFPARVKMAALEKKYSKGTMELLPE